MPNVYLLCNDDWVNAAYLDEHEANEAVKQNRIYSAEYARKHDMFDTSYWHIHAVPLIGRAP